MNGLLVARVRGIDIRVNWSVLVIGFLVAWSLATQVLPELEPDRSDTAYWVAGGMATLGFFAALVGHELGHSLVALRHDVGVRSITLWLFGGVALLDSQPESSRSALRIAIAGPLVSLTIGLVALIVGLPLTGLAGATVAWFGVMNVFLGLFNLLPAFPLDGGRVYQAWLWRRGVPADQATRRAAVLGGRIGYVMMWVGVVEILFSNLIGGIWMMGLGWFLREASTMEADQARLGGPLRRLHVSDVMTPRPQTVPADLSLEQFVDQVLWSGRHAAYPVVAAGGTVLGLVTLRKLRTLDPQSYAGTQVVDVMDPVDDLVTVAPDDTLETLAGQMGRRGENRALVMTGDRLMGIVAPSDLVRIITVIDLTEALHPTEPEPA